MQVLFFLISHINIYIIISFLMCPLSFCNDLQDVVVVVVVVVVIIIIIIIIIIIMKLKCIKKNHNKNQPHVASPLKWQCPDYMTVPTTVQCGTYEVLLTFSVSFTMKQNLCRSSPLFSAHDVSASITLMTSNIIDGISLCRF